MAARGEPAMAANGENEMAVDNPASQERLASGGKTLDALERLP